MCGPTRIAANVESIVATSHPRMACARTMTTESPLDALLDFAEQPPTTVKDVILARCCLAFDRLQPHVQQDLFATFRAIVVSGEPEQTAYACAQMAAVLELILCSPESRLPGGWYHAAARHRLVAVDLDSALA